MNHWAIRQREWRLEVAAEIRMLEREGQRIERRLGELREIRKLFFEGGVHGETQER